jgi:hypothetical protein
MRWLVFALLLSGCAAAKPKVISQTPASIEIECVTTSLAGCSSAQDVADMAQAHCRQYGMNAQPNRVLTSTSGNRWASYNCVR